MKKQARNDVSNIQSAGSSNANIYSSVFPAEHDCVHHGVRVPGTLEGRSECDSRTD